MIYILAIGIIQIGILFFIINKKHILNPSVIVCVVFLVSTIFAIYSRHNWKYQLHFRTVFVILTSILVFSIGTYYGTKIVDKYIITIDIIKKQLKMPSFCLVLMITVLLLIFSLEHYKEVTKIALQMGADINDFGDILNKSKDGFLYYNYTLTRIVTYSTYMCRAISYTCIYLFCYDKIVNKNKVIKHIYLLLPIIPLIIKIILSTGRTQFIYLAVFIIVVVGILLFQTRGVSTTTFLKVSFIGIGSLILFLLIFSWLHYLRLGNKRSIVDVISFYAGMSIPSLDDFLINGRPESYLIGNNTLFPIYDILRKLGFKLPQLYAPYDFISFNGTEGNVYTAFRRYIEDYTLLGNYIILMILGTLSSFSYNYVYKQKGNHFALILYAMFIYPIFEISIEERFFMILVGTGTIYNIIATCIAYLLLIKVPLKIGCNRSMKINVP